MGNMVPGACYLAAVWGFGLLFSSVGSGPKRRQQPSGEPSGGLVSGSPSPLVPRPIPGTLSPGGRALCLPRMHTQHELSRVAASGPGAFRTLLKPVQCNRRLC